MSLRHSETELVPSDYPNQKIAAQGGLYAASIRYHKSTFYVVCTNVTHRAHSPPGTDEFQNFILSTTDIWADEWSDPVFYDFYGIDTSLFWDDDDRVYLVGSRASTTSTPTIYQFEIDVKTGAKLSEEKLLWEGITKVFPEGPHIYKKDGWYYLLIAEGGCFGDHHAIMSRSRNIWGPFEVNQKNPVLGKADPNGYIQHTGHGDLFQDPSGQWYFVCLGVRKKNGRFVMGRESVLTTATWPENEFPTIDPVVLDVPLATNSTTCSEWPITRKPGRLDIGFVRIRDPVEEHYECDGKNVTLTCSRADLSQTEEPVTFIGKRQRRLGGSASVVLEPLDTPATTRADLKTGLTYYKDEHRFIRVFLNANANEVILEVINKAKSIERTSSRSICVLNEGAKITFGIDYTELEIVFWYAVESGRKEKFEEKFEGIDTLDITGYDFVGPIIGVYAVGDMPCKVRYSNLLLEEF